MTEVEITYSIRVNGVEIGFGTSGGSSSIDEAFRLVETAITRGDWETEPGMSSRARGSCQSPVLAESQASLSGSSPTPKETP